MRIKALKNKVIVSNLEQGMRIVNGILIPDDNGKSEGIRPRWCQVYSVGEGVDDVREGQWILVEHGRWTRTLTVKDDRGENQHLWGVDWPEAVLMVSDDKPQTEIYSKWS